MSIRILLLSVICLCVVSCGIGEIEALPSVMALATEEALVSPMPASTLVPVADNGQIARKHLEALSEAIGARLPGTPEEAQAAQYIQTTLEEMGYDVQLQEFSFSVEEDTARSANVIAVKTGLSSKEIIVGAHYDSSDESEGADDNASGVAVMLEVAEKVKEAETPYTIRFIAFGAEENDLDGSSYFVKQMSAADIKNTLGMINLDSLIAGDIAYVYGDAGPVTLRDWSMEAAKSRGIELEARTARQLDEPDGTPCNCADYSPFQAAGIPFAYFEATNWTLGEEDGMTQVSLEFGEQGAIRHTQYDNVIYIDETFPGRIDKHLRLFVTLLVDTLISYGM